MARSSTGRKIRTDSPKTEAEMFQANPPEPPSHLNMRKMDRPHWYAIVRCREFNAWTDTDLEYAAVLARAKADIERLQKEIEAEGDTISAPNGRPMTNPKHTVMGQLVDRAIRLSRLLHVHPEATEGPSEGVKKRNAKQREQSQKADAVRGTGDAEADDLIAPPPSH